MLCCRSSVIRERLGASVSRVQFLRRSGAADSGREANGAPLCVISVRGSLQCAAVAEGKCSALLGRRVSPSASFLCLHVCWSLVSFSPAFYIPLYLFFSHITDMVKIGATEHLV